jgi:signal transduction histidine kinase
MVFDPFFTTKAPGEGMGLGLAIVASTVAEFGGHVQLSSTPGDGATFTLTFPAVEAQS